MTMVATLLTSDPSVRARLARSMRVEGRALADLVLEAPHQEARRADERIREQADEQHLEAVAERPLRERLDRHARARAHAGQLERREEQQRCAQDECGEADEAQRTAHERARRRQVIADERPGARGAPGVRRRTPPARREDRRHEREQHRVRAGGAFEERLWVQDSRCGRRTVGPDAASVLLRGEGQLRHRVDGHGRIRFPGIELVDDEHHAVHADPVPGEGADEDVLARLRRRGEARGARCRLP